MKLTAKSLIIAIILPYIYSSVWASDVKVAKLVSIVNLKTQSLKHNGRGVMCVNIGVVTLQELPLYAQKAQECKYAVDSFLYTNPSFKRFAYKNLIIEQSYHYSIYKDGCILYANGPESYSEMLLRNGLAIIKPEFDNREFNGKFKYAYDGAVRNKAGLHSTDIEELCELKQ